MAEACALDEVTEVVDGYDHPIGFMIVFKM